MHERETKFKWHDASYLLESPVIDLLMVKRFVVPPDFDVYKLHFELHICLGDHALLEDSTCFADELDGSKDLGIFSPG